MALACHNILLASIPDFLGHSWNGAPWEKEKVSSLWSQTSHCSYVFYFLATCWNWRRYRPKFNKNPPLHVLLYRNKAGTGFSNTLIFMLLSWINFRHKLERSLVVDPHSSLFQADLSKSNFRVALSKSVGPKYCWFCCSKPLTTHTKIPFLKIGYPCS